MIQERPKTTISPMEQDPPIVKDLPLSTNWGNESQPLLLFSIDTVFIFGSVPISWILTSLVAGVMRVEPWSHGQQVSIYATFGLFSLVCLSLVGSYDLSRRGSLARDSFRVIGITSLVSGLLVLAMLPLALSLYGPIFGLVVWASTAFFLLMAKVTARQITETLGRKGCWCRRLIIVGDSESAKYAAEELSKRDNLVRVLGLVEFENTRLDSAQSNGVPNLGSIDTLPQIVAANSPCEVLICATAQQYARINDSINSLVPPRTTVNLALNPLMGSVTLQGVSSLDGTFPIIKVQTGWLSWQYERLKRLVDIGVAALALLSVAPVLAILAVAIKLDSPGPVLFRQVRIGRQGRPFSMYKFRSMETNAEAALQELLQQNEADGPMFKMRSDPRITRVGKVIRRLSLDELPQLFNVLEGSMSLVGPRPPLPDEVNQYQTWQLRRLEAMPGMTGLWQVTRDQDISFDHMVEQDLAYIDNWSLLLDLKILLKTLPVVVTARGAY